MVKDFIHGQMVVNTMEIGGTIKWKEKENLGINIK